LAGKLATAKMQSTEGTTSTLNSRNASNSKEESNSRKAYSTRDANKSRNPATVRRSGNKGTLAAAEMLATSGTQQ
jgi:hypothetical protein